MLGGHILVHALSEGSYVPVSGFILYFSWVCMVDITV